MDFDFDETYPQRLAAALASGKICIVPHRIAERKEETMRVTLSNGVVLDGTPAQVAETARKLGELVGNDGVWYLSHSRGLVRIVDMNEEHLRNALRRLLFEKSNEWVTMRAMLNQLQLVQGR